MISMSANKDLKHEHSSCASNDFKVRYKSDRIYS